MSFRPVLQQLNRLTLNEEQERFVALNLKGCYRIQGVSGSGKTIILAHRALRLAMEDQSATVRVFTVNRTLAVLLHSTIAALRGGKIPPNVRVHCIYDFLIDCIRLFTRIDRFRLLDDKSGEKIEISWRDFFEHAGQDPRRHVFAKPEVAALVGAIQRRIGVDRHDAGQYLREEMIYIQSACSAAERSKYLSDSRSGRSIALGRRQRESCLKVVDAWEDYLLTGGLCDVHGVSLSAAEYFLDSVRLCKIKRTFRTDHLLIDEVQDCSTLELRLLRSLISRPNGSNAFFFAGDSNQKIYAKHLNNVAAGYDFKGRSAILAQNYRNTRQILRAAFCLPEAFPPPLDAEFEVVRPEYSNYEGGKPIVFDCTNADQLQCIMEVVRLRVKSRLAVVSENDELLQRIRMVALERGYRIYDLLRNEDLDRWRTQADDPLLATLALGRMAAVKGFEFDTLIAADLSDGIVPSPGVPIEDRWREAAIVYGALTRARDELVLTFEGKPSVFVTIMQDQIDMMEGLDEAIARRILE